MFPGASLRADCLRCDQWRIRYCVCVVRVRRVNESYVVGDGKLQFLKDALLTRCLAGPCDQL